MSLIYKTYETYIVRKLDAVVTVTPHIVRKFEGRAKRVVLVQNYPKIDEIVFQDSPFENRDPIVCYAGTINTIRGEDTMISAMENVDGKLILAGRQDSDSVIQYNDNKKIYYMGIIGRQEVNELYGKSVAGLVVLKPLHNYIDSLPVKMFEYMAAGLPVIASDFPLWKQIVEENNCGICVKPDDPKTLGKAIKRLLGNRKIAQQMGINGRNAVLKKYTWRQGEKNLLKLYMELEQEL